MTLEKFLTSIINIEQTLYNGPLLLSKLVFQVYNAISPLDNFGFTPMACPTTAFLLERHTERRKRSVRERLSDRTENVAMNLAKDKDA